jgi:DsbC/DsbD-like thiol-disulfide interchange protein
MKILLFGAIMALSLAATPPDPVEWKLVDGPVRSLKAGARFTVRLAGKVEPGWHMYSMKPLAGGPVPTRIWISDAQPFLFAGAVRADAPMLAQDPSFNMEVETYEGEASFLLPLRVAGDVEPGSQVLLVNVSYQACNNKICLPPKTAKVTLAIDITR